MVFDQRSKAKKYTPRDGDTLEKIAERERAAGNPVSASEIARFNWGTDDPTVIDEHLRDDLGCYKRGADKHFVISADVRPRRDLLIPQPFAKTGLATEETHVIRVVRRDKPPQQFAACAKVRGICFEFDKSFIRPIVADDLKILNQLARKYPDSKIMIFGHTDKVGTDSYNKALSERRARSVYAFITNDADAWEKLYRDENWGIRAVQAILNDIGAEFDPGPVDGVEGPRTKEAVKRYQEARGLEADGIAGPETRKRLFAEYMTSKHDVELDPDRFMDPKCMGCGEFNPVVVTDKRCEPNRRVTFFFFHKDRLPNLPCKAGNLAPCKKQSAEPLPRHTDSFRCSFYDSLAHYCPQEAGAAELTEPPGIDIEFLDKWFIPGLPEEGGEACRIRYSLMGRREKADKVVLEVYASNYCGAEMQADGTLNFTALAEVKPVYARELEQERAVPGQEHEIADWYGESSAEEGMLKPRAGQQRFINAAFSPYTVMLRYLEKGAADTGARIRLEDFWPQWDLRNGTAVLNADSLKIRWHIENTDRLKVGRLLIIDNGGDVVWERTLDEAELAAGEFAWDGKLLSGAEADPTHMPYRVQLQARTGDEEDSGLALAAMHTEVRLFVHPATHTAVEEDYDPAEDPQSLEIRLAPLVPQESAPTRDRGTIWCQYRLARAGFHPGPVDGSARAEYTLALTEFQRSVPKRRTNPADPYQRLTPDGNENPDTLDALEGLPEQPLRPWFGEAGAARGDLSAEDAEEVLKDKGRELIVWVDDRHAYTHSNDAEIAGHVSYMNDYHGDMSIGDQRADRDAQSIARPWLPLKVGLEVLGRDAGLDGTELPEPCEAARKAVGPVRVDWTFDEIGPDVSVIDSSKYNKNLTRTRRYVEWLLDRLKASYRRKDTPRDVVYTNCPEENGGIRPNTGDLNQYFKRAFGFEERSLQPWRALPDSETESIATVVHDDYGQAEDSLFPHLIGQAGVYFHPSRIAGDGYRVRAQVRFKNCTGYQFPNSEALRRRYPRLPQAHTAAMRLWRKSSIRGYVRWAPAATGHWDSHMTRFREFYAAAHVHFVYEPDPYTAPPGSPTEYSLTDLFDPAKAADVAAFRDIIRNRVTQDYHKNNPNHIRLDAGYAFPWYHLAHFDWPWAAPANTAVGDLYKVFYNQIFNATWRVYRNRLLNEMLRRVEARSGKLRGHFLVEFLSTPRYWVEEYECDRCGNDYWWIETAAGGGSAAGKDCPDCSGHMRRKTPPAVYDPGYNEFPLPAAGMPLAATWLFTNSTEETWVHEVGHHRHLEHAASAPLGGRAAFRTKLHDAEENTHAAWPAGTGALDKGWDRCCIMSYTSETERLYFCGKCILRMRGWKVEGLGQPGGNEHDP